MQSHVLRHAHVSVASAGYLGETACFHASVLVCSVVHVHCRLVGFKDSDPSAQSSALACTILRSVLQQQPFQQQPPEAQALLQACMKLLARQAVAWGLQPALLDLLRRVPLLHAAEYEHVLRLARASGAVFSNDKLRLILCHVSAGIAGSLPYLQHQQLMVC